MELEETELTLFVSRLIGSKYVDTEFWSKNAVLGNTSAGNDDTECARKPKRMT